MDKSLYQLLQAQDRLPMHMPGHKRAELLAPYLQGLGAALDFTEIKGLDNLHRPQGILRDSMQMAASLYGAADSFYLVGGSTAGILAGVRALSKSGDKVILQRESHLAVHNAIALCQMDPVYLYSAVLPDLGITGSLTPETLLRSITENPDASLLILSCPSYEGMLSDLPALVALAHTAGLRVLVDAAHGAHLGLSAHFPAGAVASGADIVVQSLHKTLPSLTQTAICHARDAATAARLAAQLDVFQTSSPSYLLLASIDGCMRLLRDRGEELFSRWRAMLDSFYTQTADLAHLSVFDGHDPLVFDHDPGKLLISCIAANITGQGLMARLRNEHHIELEMAGNDYALAMTGMGDEDQNLTRLSLALHAVDASLSSARRAPAAPMPTPERVCRPHVALLREAEMVPMIRCAGRVCAEYLSVYPPGYPILVPGERMTQAMLARLQDAVLLKSHSKDDPDHIMVLA